MKKLILATLLVMFSVNSYAEKCEGFNACVELYTKLTGKKLTIDPVISDEMTLAAPDTDLTAETAEKEFHLFLNKNVVNYFTVQNKLISGRQGEFLTSPIYVVSQNNMPQMFSKEGLVTLVYHTKGDPDKLAGKVRNMLSKKMPRPKSVNKIVAYQNTKIFIVSDTFEVAQKVMNQIFKLEK